MKTIKRLRERSPNIAALVVLLDAEVSRIENDLISRVSSVFVIDSLNEELSALETAIKALMGLG